MIKSTGANNYFQVRWKIKFCDEETLDGALFKKPGDEKFHATVKLGDKSKLEVLGKGKVAIRLKDGSLNYITDVFYAPGICQNLLSVGQLAEKGCDLKFNKGGCTIEDAEMSLIAKTSMTRNRLFPMNRKYDAALCCKATTDNEMALGHALRKFQL
ncbi:hypothetical protein KIW84_022331 [Lathyrus oleraceus]|uniref:Retrovirus-related Pol polyprotein from transposon TNT 1-94-like beta-barrel domain-containing protein n=1 Tax=Pisum sativum TaxID=3888 RepID=A0A9D5B559_PEA|nr:hypothetical protein KIW84_022331 [Pisum sativum]